MNYKSFADLSEDIKHNLNKIPRDVSLVVGIPRSGLLPANLLALFLNVPLADLESFARGELLSSGFRGKGFDKEAFQGRILVIDDSLYSGKAIAAAREKLAPLAKEKKYKISYCCVYMNPGFEHLVDISLVSLEMPRVFEWNIFHHNVLAKACVDIDGVVCEDPSSAQNDDGEEYLKFILNARPKIIPKVKIKTLVTSRLEKYRSGTEEWLKNNGIDFEELIMLDLPDKAARLRLNNHGEYKAGEYKKRPEAVLFIESDRGQAQRIFELSGKDVYCVDTNEMYTKTTYAKLARQVRKRSGRMVRKMKRIIKKFLFSK